MIGGTLKRPSSTSGAAARTSSRSSDGATTSSRKHVGQRERLSHRLDAVEVELVDVGEVVDDVAELHGRPGQLLVGQRQAGEPGDLGHLVGGDAVGHSPEPTDDLASAPRPFASAGRLTIGHSSDANVATGVGDGVTPSRRIAHTV